MVERELKDLGERWKLLAGIVQSKYGRTLSGAPPGPLSDDGEGDEELATTSFKVKVKEPEKWKGRYDHVEREAWIRTDEGFLANVGFGLTARISRSSTPYPHYLLRSLFSSDATNGLSALAWFDAVDQQTPFTSAKQVLEAVRAHWRDDLAGDAALDSYRGAKQGSLRARDFGARVETLAASASAFGQSFSEADRMSTFTQGSTPRTATTSRHNSRRCLFSARRR